ncbi:MAG: right-handed parallel beta-helix repeat-containing protein [Lentisphaerae bacterium]|jgi:hypothetical protein|nr:right-handed parallel beta-helix repeat-containing protein [Lentisphaerota bacterium]MBT4818159.1 right-handed parallel beta-helix repeat-containing protein [Lentisphaerota bacterium]MBT5606641.1 right-handed parallel beta-helix repeat-containing protein [Lentisphaerota bacterium]MBT7059083.1 right-handed parallel beta-helix repeat-containing protein [Lentisphaerota bacterium]MBT7842632.1 right-handed parallel beta-helix repeat-containing protein [Lentisphaerota bacterium]
MRIEMTVTFAVALVCMCQLIPGTRAQDSAPTPGVILYVALDGNDAWGGGLPAPNVARTDGPFATLERARKAIVSLKAAGPLPRGGVAVHLHEGAYELAATFKLTAADTGSESAPIVYRSHPGEKVILTGGRSISGFVPHKGKVLKADVGALGLKGVGFRQVLFDGKRQILARYPNFDPGNPHGGGFAYVDGQPLNMYKPLPGGENVRVIQCKPRDVRRWARPELGEVIIFPRYNWNNTSAPIASADPTEGTITLAKDIADPEHPQSRSIRPLDRFYVRNLPEELDAPGEWYLDTASWTLYFWPPRPMADATVRAPVLQTVIDIGPKANWISIRGFVIEGCDGVAVNVRDSENCLIVGNTIHDTGGKLGWFAAVTVTGGRNCGVVGNDLYEICNDGIRLQSAWSERHALDPIGHYADNNYLHHIGVLNGHGCGISIRGTGLRVSHNLIHDTTRCGIFGGGHDCVVEYNHIRHVNLETEDTAGYYVGGNWHIRGHIIRYNYVHDVLGYGRRGDTWTSPHYAWGIYLDDDHSGAHVYGNIVARTTLGGSHIHAGRDNLLENNIFIDHTKQQMQYSGHGREHWVLGRHRKAFKEAMAKPAYRKKYPELVDADLDTIWEMTGNTFRRNIISYSNPAATLYKCSTRDGNVFRDNQSDHNLVWHCGLPVTVGQYGMKDTPSTLSWEQWQEKGFDTHSVVGDPLFVDPANDNYRLKPESPAFRLGFEPIPVEEIGPYASALRASWPIVEAKGVRETPLVDTKVDLPPQLSRKRPTAVVSRVAGAPFADGDWPGRLLTVAQQTTGGAIRTPAGSFRMCHDGNNVYVALTVPVKDAATLKLGTEWTVDDAAEICFQDLSDATPGPIFVVHGFASGTHESVTEAGASVSAATAVGAAVRFAARTGEGNWQGQWTVPLKAAGITYKPGCKLAFNLGIRRTETDEWIQWCGSGATWRLAEAGRLILE